jgi:hypothetical protein
VYIEFDDAEQRAIGAEFLEKYGGYTGAAQYFWETMHDQHGLVDEDPGPGGDPWERLVYEQAQVWQQTARREDLESTVGGSFTVTAIPIGASHTTRSTTQVTDDAWYPDAPEDGVRLQVPHDACVAD